MAPPEQTKTNTIPDSAPLHESLELNTIISHHIQQVLNACNGRVEGEKGAAKVLNIHPSTLRKRMKKLNIPFGRNV